MKLDIEKFKTELEYSLKTFDKVTSEALCDKLISHLKENRGETSVKDIGDVLLKLRNKKMFQLMSKVGEAAADTNRQSYRIRKVYAQSLIELGKFKDALEVLNKLVEDTENESGDFIMEAKKEWPEAKALIGRTYKQLYVNTIDNPGSPCKEYMEKAVRSYYEVYEKDPVEKTYQGINAVALLKRAERDGINLTGFQNADDIVRKIFDVTKYKIDDKSAIMWDYAIAIECLVAMNIQSDEEFKNLLEWIGEYINSKDADAFELNSTLRQMEQVWLLNTDTRIGNEILPILRAMLLKQEGGEVTIDLAKYGLSKRRSFTEAERKTYQSVLGNTSFKSYKWWLRGVNRCMAIAKITKEASEEVVGTGFLLRGSDLNENIKDEFVLLTNNHVISDDPHKKIYKITPLFPDKAVITFQALDLSKEFRVSEIIWTSEELDVTVLRFIAEDLIKIKELTKELVFYPLAKGLPDIDNDSSIRVYIIGHPKGGVLQFSFQDNILLVPGNPLIRYRTPTEGGSSGSPVFNEDWELMGIHHASISEAQKHVANEGIYINAVRDALGKFLNSGK